MKSGALVAAGSLVFTVLVAGSAHAQTAKAEFHNAQGQSAGSATLTQRPNGVKIALHLSHLPPGAHGFHIHAVGKCDPPAFTTAGGHLNPGGRLHGTETAVGPHDGDLPNLAAGPDGTVKAEAMAYRVTLGPGKDSLFHPGGTSLVIHAGPDDYTTDPAGNSGARIACAIITQ